MMGEGVENLKCYFMVGLPEERDEDVVAIAELVGRIVTPRARAAPPRRDTSASRSTRSYPSRGRRFNGTRCANRRNSNVRSRSCART